MMFGLEIHPAIVHFPIALSVVGALAAVAYLFLRKEWLRWFAPVLLSIALMGAVAAYFTGESAEDRAEKIGVPENLIQLHEERGIWGLWMVGLAAFLSWVTHGKRQAVWLSSLIAVMATSVILYTGHVGGKLVFIHGAGHVGAAVGGQPAGGEKGAGEKAGGENSGGENDDD